MGMPLPTSVRSSTAFPRVCCRRGRASPCISQTARPWSFESGSTSLHRAAAAPKGGRLPPARGGEREWSCLSLHRFASTAFPLFAAGVDEPLPASLSVALHLQPQPIFARDSHRSSGEDPGQCRAAPRPPAKGTPRPRPPNRIPSYPCVHHFTPRTRSIATFRSSLTVFRSSPISSSECTGVVDGPHPDRRPRQCPVHPFITAYAVSQPVEITPHHFHPGGESAPATAFETTAPTLRQSPLLAAKLARTPRVSSHSPGDRTRIALFMIVSVAYGEAR